MNQTFFNEHDGLTTLHWWLGQVVDEKNWVGNENDKIHKRDDIPGWGKRYKVRIFGRDSKKKDTKDDQLEMAEILYPVTAGSGLAGATQTANIRQGTYVIGFYKDGIDATEPIILGVLGNNAQTRLSGKDPTEGFIPRTGYKGLTGDKSVSTKNMYAEGPSSLFFDEAGNVNPLSYNVNIVDQVKDGTPCEFLPKTRTCEGPGGETRGIQSTIKKLIAIINRIKAETNSFIGSVSNLSNKINNIVNDAVNLISQAVKTTLDKARGYIVNKLNAGVSDLIDKLPPNKTASANDKIEKATDTLQCVFNKIVAGLGKLIKDLLNKLIDNLINSPLCAAEQLLTDILGSVLGQVTNAIDQALSIVNSIFGSAMNIVGKVTDVLSIISGVLSFLSCDEAPDCSMGDEWSFWNGAACKLDKVSADLAKKTEGLTSGAAPAPPCNTAQIPCGPPQINISGPVGSGALANPIISATGSILAIDIVNGGSGYVSPPTITVTQDCNKGGGAVIKPIIETQVNVKKKPTSDIDQITTGIEIGIDTETTTVGIGSIVGFDIIDAGTGYLPSPDGSTGGSGFTFSEKCDTIVKTSKSGYQAAKKPGTVVNVLPNDIVYLPASTTVRIFNSDGIVTQTLRGLGQLTPITINSAGSFTAPDCSPGAPATGISTGGGYRVYPVTLKIGRVIISNPGSNYNKNDKIVITPSNGAVLNPVYDDAGSLIDVNIANPGIGFTEYPTIYIDSETGINAEIIPQFEIVRMKDVSEDKDIIPKGIGVINVIDCVGKIPPKTTFNIVPM
jgi:hypothetical protein